MSWFKQVTSRKKAVLAQMAIGPMEALARKCTQKWPDPNALDHVLQEGLQTLPYCHLMYAVDVNGMLISSNVQSRQVDPSLRHRSLSGRPFMNNTLPFQGLTLSQVYISQFNLQPCITAMCVVRPDERVLGFIAADFQVDHLPEQDTQPSAPAWTQYRGDPAIRSTLFMQTRSHSAMDQRLDEVLAIIADMMQERGIFHAKIHFSSSRISVWTVEDPYCYQIHPLDELIDADRMLVYAKRPYTDRAQVPQESVAPVLNQLKVLRDADENIYLRSASFNLINGMVGLTFSCDGSLYINYEEFLSKDISFWFGKTTVTDSSDDSSQLKR